MKKVLLATLLVSLAASVPALDVLRPAFVKNTTAQNSSSVPLILTLFGAPIVEGDAEFLMVDPTNDDYIILFNGGSTGDSDGGALIRYNKTNLADFDIIALSLANTAIDAANGAAVAPTDATIRDMGMDTNGHVIFVVDPNGADPLLPFLIRADFNGASDIVEVIASGVNLDGSETMTVLGTTAYIEKQGSFAGGTPADNAIYVYSTAGAANSAQTGTVFVNDTAFIAAGITTSNNINALASNGTNLILGVAAEFYQITPAGVITSYKTSASIATDLGTAVTGTANNALLALPNGEVYFSGFAGGPAPLGNGWVKLANDGPKTASILLSETDVEADADFKTTVGGLTTAELEANNRNFGFSDGDFIFSNESSDDTVWRVILAAPAVVSEWMAY